jgi:hypothetical protein
MADDRLNLERRHAGGRHGVDANDVSMDSAYRCREGEGEQIPVDAATCLV